MTCSSVCLHRRWQSLAGASASGGVMYCIVHTLLTYRPRVHGITLHSEPPTNYWFWKKRRALWIINIIMKNSGNDYSFILSHKSLIKHHPLYSKILAAVNQYLTHPTTYNNCRRNPSSICPWRWTCESTLPIGTRFTVPETLASFVPNVPCLAQVQSTRANCISA